MPDSGDPSDSPLPLPIDGVLDLHTFRPRDVKDLVGDYLDACRQQQILRVRIIHGKGIGALRSTVHALLRKRPDVREFHLASEPFGGWGATIVHLHPPPDPPRPESPPAPELDHPADRP